VRRPLLIALCIAWTATTLACTGAGGKWIDLPGGLAVFRSDHRDYYFSQHGGDSTIGGHITDVGFDERFVLLRRDLAAYDYHPKPKHRLTGKIEFYVVVVSPPKRHGPFTEAEFGAARERLGVPAGLALEPTDTVRDRVGPPRQ
jgi:hypothetical protein